VAARRKRRKHSARASVQVHELSKAGTSIALEIHAANKKVGQLVIGRGSLTWFGNHWKQGRRFSWSAFAEFMERGR
jgi:transposase